MTLLKTILPDCTTAYFPSNLQSVPRCILIYKVFIDSSKPCDDYKLGFAFIKPALRLCTYLKTVEMKKKYK